MPAGDDITALLQRASAGEPGAFADALPLVYDELRRLAASQLRREDRNHTLNPTALVHEAYMRLSEQTGVQWESRGHLLAIAATAMRRLLIDHARTKSRKMRATDGERVAYPEDLSIGDARRAGGADRARADARPDADQRVDLLALDDALRRLERIDPRRAQVVVLRFFGGVTIETIAETLAIAPATVKRDWDVARLWLLDAMGQ
jgi:RNA polymerase sigma-70 factor, ECF subfamily